jgi:hypothetical protein
MRYIGKLAMRTRAAVSIKDAVGHGDSPLEALLDILKKASDRIDLPLETTGIAIVITKQED